MFNKTLENSLFLEIARKLHVLGQQLLEKHGIAVLLAQTYQFTAIFEYFAKILAKIGLILTEHNGIVYDIALRKFILLLLLIIILSYHILCVDQQFLTRR